MHIYIYIVYIYIYTECVHLCDRKCVYSSEEKGLTLSVTRGACASQQGGEVSGSNPRRRMRSSDSNRRCSSGATCSDVRILTKVSWPF